MKTLLLVVALLGVVSCAPRPDVMVLPAVYSPPPSYSYSTFVSHPTPGLNTPYTYPYANNNPRLYQLACYLVPLYDSPYLTLLCLYGILSGNRIEPPVYLQLHKLAHIPTPTT